MKEVDRKICHEQRLYFKVFSIRLEGQKQLLSSSHPHAYVTMHIEARSASANKKVRFCIKCVLLVTGMGQCLNDCSRMLGKSLQCPQSSVMHIYSGYGKYSDPLQFFTLCYIAAIC